MENHPQKNGAQRCQHQHCHAKELMKAAQQQAIAIVDEATRTGESGAGAAAGRPGGADRSVLVTNSAIACASIVLPLPAQAQPSAVSASSLVTPSCASVMYTTDSHLHGRRCPA